MTTNTETNTDTTTQHEFELPCDCKEGQCEYPARWTLWLSHAVGGCGHTSLICDVHKPIIERCWATILALCPPTPCERCGQIIPSDVRDNLKWTRIR